MFVESIQVEDGFKDDLLTFDKWSLMHRFAIHKTIMVTVFTILFFITMEVVELLTTETTKEILPFQNFIISIVLAVLIAFFFMRIKEKLEDLIDKLFYY